MNAADERFKQELQKLAALDEAGINFDDIAQTSAADWQGAERGKFFRPMKQQLTVRLDADVLAWLKASGKGYQTRLNAILRAAMERELA